MTVAYEFGIVCKVPATVLPDTMIREFAGPQAVVDGWVRSPSWASVEITFGSSQWPASVQANVADDLVSQLTHEAQQEGVLADPAEYQAVLTITLSGDVDWAPLLDAARSAKDRWSGVVFDEASGFAATLD